MKTYKKYNSYSELMTDSNSGDYAILTKTGVRLKKVDNKWILGSVCHNDPFCNFAKSACTQFEVYAHPAIPVGNNAELNGVVRQALEENMTDSFYIRSVKTPNAIKVIVDWGDGNITDLSELTPIERSGYSDKWYLVSNTYNQHGKYVVSIHGIDYHAICRNGETSNILSRPFGADLLVADHLVNFSSFCRACHLLVNVDASESKFADQASNVSSMFSENGKNLNSVTGFAGMATIKSCQNVFKSSYRMTRTDFRIPATLKNPDSAVGCFYDNYQLVADIKDLLPKGGFVTPVVDATELFVKCNKLTCNEDPGLLLWNDKRTTWILPEKTTQLPCVGTGKLNELAPASWGGSSPDTIIEPKHEKLNTLEPVVVEDGVINLSRANNTYKITPKSQTTISVSDESIADMVGAEFFVVLDFSEGVQSITWPENWEFKNGDVPNLSAEGCHHIQVTYSTMGSPKAWCDYIGVSIPPIENRRGIWFTNVDGQLDTSRFYGQTYVGDIEFDPVEDDSIQGTLYIGPGSQVTGNIYGPVNIVLNGGTIASYYLIANEPCTFTVLSGNINNCYTAGGGELQHVIVVKGGTINHISDSGHYGSNTVTVDISGTADIGRVSMSNMEGDHFNSVVISGGIVRKLSFDNESWEGDAWTPASQGSLTITGGTVYFASSVRQSIERGYITANISSDATIIDL